MAVQGRSLWKPSSDKDGHAVFLADQNLGSNIALVDPKTGRVIATAKEDVGARGKNDGRWHYRFDSTGSTYGSNFVIQSEKGQYYYISDGAGRWDNLSPNGFARRNTSGDIAEEGYSGWDTASYTNLTQTGSYGGHSESNVPGIKGRGNVAEPTLLDPSLNERTQITDTEIQFTDPIDTLRRIAAENAGQIDANHIRALEQAGKLSEANTQQLIDYIDTMSPYQRQLIGIENAFNQQQKLQAAEAAVPGVTDMLRGELKNAQTLASGRLLTTSEDRALEQIARTAGADAAWSRGLGDDSLIGQTLSDQLSVTQRQQVMAHGQNYLTQALQAATSTLMDTPQKAAMGSAIPATPPKSVSDLYTSQFNALNQLTTMSPTDAQSSIVGQRTAQAQMDYNTKATNAQLNEAFIDRGINIAAVNAQAENQFNTDVINDQQQTQAAENKSKYYDYLEYVKSKYGMDDSEYVRLSALIDNGSFSLDMLFSRYPDLMRDYTADNRTSSSMQGRFDTKPNESEDVDTTETNAEIKDTKDLVTSYLNTTYKPSHDSSKIVQSDGSITIPRPNLRQANFSYPIQDILLRLDATLEGIV